MQKIMRKVFLVMVLALAVCAQTSVYAAEGEVSILSVDGYGSSEAVPDRAMVTLSVVTTDPEAEAARNENAQLMQAVTEAVKAQGIEARNIKTTGYSVNPAYDRQGKSIIGYTVSNQLNVTLDDIGITGQVIDAAMAKGVNRVSSLSFSVRDTEKLRKEALLAAIADAKNKAEIIAGGLGKKIIGIKNVSESVGNAQPMRYDSMKMMRNEAETPIEAGTVSVNANVHIEFEMSR